MRKSPFSAKRFNRQWKIIRILSRAFGASRAPSGLVQRLASKAYLDLLLQSQYADPAQLRDLQQLRLQETVQLAHTAPWWHEHLSRAGIGPDDLKDLRDLERIPPVYKQMLRGIPQERFQTKEASKARLLLRRTSGTTAMPFEWGVDRDMLFVETASFFYRLLSWHNVLPGRAWHQAMVASCMPANYAVPFEPFFWTPLEEDATQKLRSFLQTAKAHHLRVLQTYPTHLILMAKKIAEQGLQQPFTAVVTGGQDLDESHRHYVETQFDCPVLVYYGAVELELLALRCPLDQNTYHLNAERLILEITDEQGKNVSEGEEGLITFTSLTNRAMPLLRYQLGDRGRLVPGACACGRTLPRFQLRGKRTDFIRLPSGRQLLFEVVNMMMLTQFFKEVAFYQIQQISLSELVVRLKLNENTDRAAFEKRFLPMLQTYVQHELEIKFEYPQTWPDKEARKLKTIMPLDQGSTQPR